MTRNTDSAPARATGKARVVGTRVIGLAERGTTWGVAPGGWARLRAASSALGVALVLLLGFGPACAGKRPAREPFTIASARLDQVHEVLERHIQAGDISGAVAGIARRGVVVHFEAQGLMDVEANVPMRTDAIFRMASSTKVAAGVAALMLLEEGKIALSDPVSKYIPEFRDTKVAVPKSRDGEGGSSASASEFDLVPANREITIRDLMTHTSGLLSGGAGGRAVPPPPHAAGDTLASFIPKLGGVPLDFQPGSRWSYSPGTGIDVLGRIIEIASGKTFDEFLRTRVFEPLGMPDTFFGVPDDRAARLVPLYRRVDGSWQRAPNANRMSSRTYFSGSGGLVSTAHDYLRFQEMLANGGELDGRRLLRPETVKLMATNQVGDLFRGFGGRQEGMGFGLTVAVVLDAEKAHSPRSAGAFGWGGAFGTQNWSDPQEGLAVILMIQQPNGRVQADFERAVREAITAEN